MPLPRDPTKVQQFKISQKIHTLLLYALGCCKWDHRTALAPSAKTKAKASKTLREQRNSPEWREKAREQGKKCNNLANWFFSLTNDEKEKHIRKVCSMRESRKDKTYLEIYGPERAVEESRKREESNRRHWDRIGRKLDERPHQGCGEACNEWRNAVFKRDLYICQSCFTHSDKLQAHHIKPWSLFIELRFVIPNGKTLCRTCHKEIHKQIRLAANFLKQLHQLQENIACTLRAEGFKQAGEVDPLIARFQGVAA